MIFICGVLLFASSYIYAFVIHTDAYVEGNMSIDMDCAKGAGNGQSERYELELDSTDGTTHVANNYESGETSVDIDYVADPDAGLWGGEEHTVFASRNRVWRHIKTLPCFRDSIK